MAIGQELLNVPMGDMIRQMAFAIAEGQAQLDAASIEVAEMMGGLKVIYDEEGRLAFDDSRVFFGHEWMTLTEAEAHMAADVGLSGGDPPAMMARIRAINGLGDNAPTNTLVRVPVRLSMLELGFTPTFYQFVDTIIEVKIAIKITRETERSQTRRDRRRGASFSSSVRNGGLGAAIFGGEVSGSRSASVVSTSQVDASYSAKYSYSAEGASLLRTKLAPVPPPPVLEERVRRMMEEDAERRRKAVEARLASPD